MYLPSVQLALSAVVDINCLPILYNSAVNTFWSFETSEPVLNNLKMEFSSCWHKKT